MANIPIYIPTYISDDKYHPSKVLPRLLFYNNKLQSETYYLEGYPSGSTASLSTPSQTSFPYFDNYSVVTGSFPTTGSKSLLLFNEEAVYGSQPTASVYSEYWSRYVELLYNPYTKLLNCSAIIPLADYRNINQNDIVEFRGNYYHLRAINDYSLKNGECSIQLLGPILDDSLNLPKVLFPKCLGYDPTDCLLACYNKCECTPPCPPSQFFFSSEDASEMVLEVYITGSNYQLTLPTQTSAAFAPIYQTLFTASWGDGTTSYGSGSGVANEVSHTYTNPGTYEIRLKGQIAQLGNSVGLTSQNTLANILTKVKQWGSIHCRQMTVAYGANNLTEIPNGEPGLSSILNWQSTFSRPSNRNSCNIPTPPADLFKYCCNTTSCTNLFASNFNLTTIPNGFLSGLYNNQNFASAFFACINLTSIGNNLFPPLPNASQPTWYGPTSGFINISGTFRNVYNLPTMPSDLFNNISGSYTLTAMNCFNMSSTTNALTGSVFPIWTSPSSSGAGVWAVTDFYNNCVNASNYASIPAAYR